MLHYNRLMVPSVSIDTIRERYPYKSLLPNERLGLVIRELMFGSCLLSHTQAPSRPPRAPSPQASQSVRRCGSGARRLQLRAPLPRGAARRGPGRHQRAQRGASRPRPPPAGCQGGNCPPTEGSRSSVLMGPTGAEAALSYPKPSNSRPSWFSAVPNVRETPLTL